MRYRFFSIMALDPNEGEEELNRFCAGQRVVDLKREFVAAGERSYWSICVGYQARPSAGASERRGKIDYREVLNEADFAVFVQLRGLRKQLADQEGIPAYALFTNEQLAEMVRRKVSTRTGLAEISGVGAARIEKYGEPFLSLLSTELIAQGKESGGGDEKNAD